MSGSPQPLRRTEDWFGSLSKPSLPRADRDEHGRRVGRPHWSCEELPVTFLEGWQRGTAGSGTGVRSCPVEPGEPDEPGVTQLALLD